MLSGSDDLLTSKYLNCLSVRVHRVVEKIKEKIGSPSSNQMHESMTHSDLTQRLPTHP